MTIDKDTSGITNSNVYLPYFDIDMHYKKYKNRRQQGQVKLEWTIKHAMRFGFVSAIVCAEVWQTNRAKTLEFLNKLVGMGLLQTAKTIRAADGRVYVLTYAGAQYARELTQIDFPFRSTSEPIQQVNQNSIMHDSILSLVLALGIQNSNTDGIPNPLWKAYLTELEFKRLFPSNDVKNVDALVLLNNSEVAAIEIEHSFKRKQQHEQSILKFKSALFGEQKLYDKVFLIVASTKIQKDTQRFYQQLLSEMPTRYDKKTKLPLLKEAEAEIMNEKIIIRTKFINLIDDKFYSEF
ncbi:hypothetical protein NH514_22645 [Pseudoalteromonas sp. ACER1]|uniref:hypothetical protein n=1 Tax=unclassified Pseudoalteromonas TaxID=194690 RepID=UPI001F1DEB31|nr:MULTISPECIES: hypothetical protein [unclassified Pseudoalteromonas]MCF2850105.1 hypothetical protein [Pseudoalteromonas sp. PAST1]MCO7213471.1 hypothetical protein [Pseudoalteromonas sp. ACER1]